MKQTVRTGACDLGATPPRQRAYVHISALVRELVDFIVDFKWRYKLEEEDPVLNKIVPNCPVCSLCCSFGKHKTTSESVIFGTKF